MPAIAPETVTTDELMRKAFDAFRRGAFDDAEVFCGQTLARDPEHIAGSQLLAAAAERQGEPSRALAVLEKLVSRQPCVVDAHLQIAGLLRRLNRAEEAIASLKKTIELDPDSFAAHNDLGLVYLTENQAEMALANFTRAADIDPAQPRVFFNIGLANESLGNVVAAAKAFQQAAAIDPNFVEAQWKLGLLLWSEGAEPARVIDCFQAVARARPGTAVAAMSEAKIFVQENKIDAAERAVRRAIELEPQNGGSYCFLAGIYMQMGRFQDAAASIEMALAHDFWLPMAYCQLAHIKKMTELDRPLISRIEWLLREPRFTEEDRSEFHFALGKAYDDLGEYERAIFNIDDANRAKRRGRSFDAVGNDRLVESLISRFTAEFFSQNAEGGLASDIPTLIVGMPRSGTTLVEQILSSHPEVEAGGELCFWKDAVFSFRCDARGRVDPAWIAHTGEAYATLLRDISPTARRVTDKRPLNFQLIGLVRIVFPNARIIHCSRHPLDTCLSIYFQNFAQRIDFAQDRADIVSAYRAYSRLMTHWRNVLPEDRFLEVQYEELVQDRETQARKIIAFCGLDWNEACLRPERNQRAVQTASVWQVRQPVYKTSLERWRRYEPWLGALRELVGEDA
jgi:tetratricopeptide (TPR) repeat protein